MSANRPADFGTKLRQARERKGVALREIANRTKISIAVLEALERSDVARLPGGLFSRAFVRTYAKEVGLDPDVTVEEFIALLPQDAVAAAHGRVDQVEDTQLFESDRRVASSVLWILLISVPLAGGVLYLGMHQTGTSDRAPGSPAARAAPPETAAPPTPVVPAATAPRAGPPPGTTAPAPPAPEAAPSGNATPGSTPSGRPSPSAAASPAGAPQAAAVEVLKIELSARRPVWVSATVDGQKAIGRLLQVGDKEVVDVKRELMLTAGDASAVRMLVNGVEARPLGKTGEVITARVTPANVKEYLQVR